MVRAPFKRKRFSAKKEDQHTGYAFSQTVGQRDLLMALGLVKIRKPKKKKEENKSEENQTTENEKVKT